jgi:putative transport protein
MRWLVQSFRENPEVPFFLVLALGYGIGNIRIAGFKFGPVLGVLIAGIAVGQFTIPISEPLKNSFFMLFLFAVGYQTGPQFFQSLRMTGPGQIVLTLVVCATAIGLTIALGSLIGFDPGEAAGLLAGAMTGSAAFGAASEAINGLHVTDAQHQLLLANAGVAFAVCYLIGLVGVVWILTRFGPWMMRVDLRTACEELEKEMGTVDAELIVSNPNGVFETRTYQVPSSWDGRTIAELELEFKPYRVFIERVRRNSKIRKPEATEPLRVGDVVTLWGRREAVLEANQKQLGAEIYDRELLDIGVVKRDIVMTHPPAANLGGLATNGIARGIFLERIQRAGKDLPFTLQTPLEAGDVLSVIGDESHIAHLTKVSGYEKQQTESSNLTNVAAAIFIGALIGLPALGIGGVELTLTTFVGVLLGGVLLGRLSSVNPRFGGIAGPALWLMDSLGLCGFLALVGMQAGPGFVRGLQQSGLALVGSAAIVVLVTHVVGILVGRYVLRMHPAVVLGACAGAGTSAPALGALLEASDSRVPALSYGVGYALGNIVLAIGASAVVKIVGPS